MRDLESIKNLVKKLVRREVDDLQLVDVRVNSDEDSDGNALIKIDVIFAGSPDDLNPRKLASMLRHLRTELSEQDELAFPLLSFISQKDLTQRKRASA